MILQILPVGFTSEGFIQFANKYFKDEFNFIILKNRRTDKVFHNANKPDNCLILSSVFELYLNKKARNWVKSSSGIVINWVDGKILLFLAKFLHKTGLLFWGGDLRLLKNGLHSKHLIVRLLKKLITKYIEKAKYIYTLIPGDYKELCQLCSPKGSWSIAWIITKDMSEATFEHLYSNKAYPPRILVGNSSTSTNRHCAAFDILNKYSDCDLRIYCPLSYGDMRYKEIVLAKGKEVFKSKFFPVTTFMDEEAYRKFLSTITAAVFNNDRQQGMGNIRTLLRLGAKVYLSRDNPAFLDLQKEGFRIFDIDSINDLSFQEFIYADDMLLEENKKVGSFTDLTDKAVRSWNHIIKTMECGK